MSNAIFPTFKGLGWPIGRRPYFSTIVSKSAGGQEVRIPNFPYPLEEFSLPINHLHGDASYYPNLADFQQLWGFYVARLGPWDSFLFRDPVDNYTVANATYEGLSPVTGQNIIATGDGSTKVFQLMRNLGGALQPVFAINGITASLSPPISSPFVNVFVAGTPVFSGWTVSSQGVLTFTTAPGNGSAIAADFAYFFRCVFADDNLDFGNFMQMLFRIKIINLRQVYG